MKKMQQLIKKAPSVVARGFIRACELPEDEERIVLRMDVDGKGVKCLMAERGVLAGLTECQIVKRHQRALNKLSLFYDLLKAKERAEYKDVFDAMKMINGD